MLRALRCAALAVLIATAAGAHLSASSRTLEGGDSHTSVKGGGERYASNLACIRNNCVKPVFPGLWDLSAMDSKQWQCADLSKVTSLMSFCRNAVNYDVALPQKLDSTVINATLQRSLSNVPPDEARDEVRGLLARLQQQEKAATMTFMYHMSALGMDGWDYPKPEDSLDECVKNIWRMSCYTYFPRAPTGCQHGKATTYMRPCKSSCENYAQACAVECCDGSVQCVFTHKETHEDNVTITTSGYSPHDGPSSLCTGSARRSMAPASALWLLLGALSFGDSLQAMKPGRVLLVASLAALAMGLQGWDLEHTVANWRNEPDYLVLSAFVPPGSSALEAVQNSCSLSGLAPGVQCNGHGSCQFWDVEAVPPNPTTFCKCDAGWAGIECNAKRPSQTKTFLFALLTGFFGADQFYLGYVVGGVVKLICLTGIALLWLLEYLVSGRLPLNMERDMRSGLGVVKVLFVAGAFFWWSHDVIRAGAGSVPSATYRTAEDLPHWLFWMSTVTLALVMGFACAYIQVTGIVMDRRKSGLMMNAEAAMSKGFAKDSPYGSMAFM